MLLLLLVWFSCCVVVVIVGALVVYTGGVDAIDSPPALVWDLRSGEKVCKLKGHLDIIK